MWRYDLLKTNKITELLMIFFCFSRRRLCWHNTLCGRASLLCTQQMVCTLCSYMSGCRLGVLKTLRIYIYFFVYEEKEKEMKCMTLNVFAQTEVLCSEKIKNV